MNTLELLQAARAAEDHWRAAHRQVLNTLDLSPEGRAARDEAEAALRTALQSLGTALLRQSGDPRIRAALEAALSGVPLVAPAPPAPAPPPEAAPPAPAIEPPLAAVPPAPVTVAAPVAITAAVLENLSHEMTSGRAIARTPPIPVGPPEPRLEDAVPALQDALTTFGEPLAPEPTAVVLTAEVSRLCGYLHASLPVWADLAPRANFVLTGWMTARLRHLQTLAERLCLDSAEAPLATGIRRLSAHSKDTQPGFIYGLGLGHQPQHGDWVADAAEWRTQLVRVLAEAGPVPTPAAAPLNPDDAIRVLTERVRTGLEATSLSAELKAILKLGVAATDKRLVNLARPHVDALDGSTLAPLRKAIRDLVEAESEAEEGGEAARNALPTDWPLFAETRDRAVVIVGGDPRPERAARLQTAFGFREVEWMEGSTTRKIDSLRERMKSGSIDLVIVLRAFNSHKVSDAIFAVKSPVCTAVLADGYGVTQVRLGLERFLVRAAA
jgi:hypothetical protein